MSKNSEIPKDPSKAPRQSGRNGKAVGPGNNAAHAKEWSAYIAKVRKQGR